MSEVSMFDANGMDRGSAFDLPLYGPSELQNGAGGVPDPRTAVGQKVGPTAGDFHAQLDGAEEMGRYGDTSAKQPLGAFESLDNGC